MKALQLWTADGRQIAHQVQLVCTFRSRYACLLRIARIDEQSALLLSPGGSVHTVGMRCAIDVVFLSRQMRIVGLAPNISPWRFRRAPPGTGRVLELAAGRIEAIGLSLGMFLVVESGGGAAERPTVRMHQPLEVRERRVPCQRLPIQFSLRLPLERRCATCSSSNEGGGPRVSDAAQPDAPQRRQI